MLWSDSYSTEVDAGSSAETTKTHSRAKGRPDILAGSAYTDARHATFNAVSRDQYNAGRDQHSIGRDQHVTYVNHAPEFKEILATLKPVGRGGYVSKCLEGTRHDIFKKIDHWMDDVDAPNVLWIGPGAGKSAIASSLVSKLTVRGRLGSSFFFRRGDFTLSNPGALWRTVAYDLSQFDPTFAEHLVEVLKERRIDPEWPDIGLHFKFLVEESLMKIYNNSSSHLIPIIVIDALDECDSDSSPAQRKALLDTLTQWSYLPRKFKLIVTSRNERVSESFRAISEQIVLLTGDNVNDDANKDIRWFFEKRLAVLGGSSCPEWPGKQVFDALTKRAAGLFIWAETVVRFVEQGLPDEQLKDVLSGDLGEGDNITRLYCQVLELSFQEVKGHTLEVTRLVIAFIALAKVPLPYNDVHKFVSQSKVSVKFILDKLSSVISIDRDTCVHFGHLSFIEFLCDPNRCPEQFLIDQGKDSQELAKACFRLMKDGLKFNICNLETSDYSNAEVEDLPKLIDINIPPLLLYSCRFWVAHLCNTTVHQDGLDSPINEVKEFLLVHFLYWLEVMSLIQEVSVANTALLTVVPWIEVCGVSLLLHVMLNIINIAFAGV
jgi:hypothetical protein